MAALRRINSTTLQQLKNLLANNSVHVKPITVKYKDYTIGNEVLDAKNPLQFRWSHGSQVEPLFFDFYTWGTAESKKFPGTFLALGTSTHFRIVGFPLYLLPQDREFVYLSFKLGNNEGGKNRWFGRGRSSQELRTAAQTDQLAVDIRQALQKSFPEPLFKHPTLSGEWLTLARLPLADLKAEAEPAQRIALKTLILEKLLQAFFIAERLRDDSLKAVGMQANETDTEDDFSTPTSMTTPLNQILYGPPGTGKTHHTKARAVGIIENLTDEEVVDAYTREEIRGLFEEYRKAGQVEFVTFHQAFGYEDFVEGIKPILVEDEEGEQPDKVGYKLIDGLFLRLSRFATYALHLKHREQLPPTDEADFDSLFNDLYAMLLQGLDEGKTSDFKTKSGPEVTVTSVANGSKIYINHKEGKTDHAPYLIKRENLRKLFDTFHLMDDIKNVYKDIVACIGHCNASGYWALLNYLKTYARRREKVYAHQQFSLQEQIQRAHQNYEEVQAATKSFDFAKLTKEDFQNAPRFVLIIDEINRGNVANIFGELITLLEDDKRAGRPEALTVKLPYSKEDFTVPENLYLLGTMNTADRSVEALDTALRRRFSFTEMLPDAGVIREQVGENGVIGEGAEVVDVARILEVLNSRLEQLLDHDHCLGHALLLRITNLDDLRAAFQRNILPLLQEYFFGDWGKIGLVLGEKFISVVEAKSRVALAKFGKYDGGNVRDKPLYRLTKPGSWDAAAFQSIYATT